VASATLAIWNGTLRNKAFYEMYPEVNLTGVLVA
jgi:hypothetical protein